MKPRLHGVPLIAWVAACAVLALSACTNHDGGRAAKATPSPTTSTTVPPAPRVLVLGDSNLFQSSGVVDDALRDAGMEPAVLGVPAFGLKDLIFWFKQLSTLLDDDPDVVVVGLGTNDTTSTAYVEKFPERLDLMMEELGDRPVVWITHVDDRPAAPASAGRAINAAIRAAPERWPNLTVLDFTFVMAADPTILSGDNLHFTPSGRVVYAEEITKAVTSRLAG